MTVFAHVGGVPVEEGLAMLAAGPGASLLLARMWLRAHLRREAPPEAR